LAPKINEIKDINLNNIELGLKGDVQLINSSLAIQIAKYWIDKYNNNSLNKFKWVQDNHINKLNDSIPILNEIIIDNYFKNGLEKCFWPGRNQIIESDNKNVTYYIDGAHTIESIEQFLQWFKKIKINNNNNMNEKNVLLFNYTGERDSLHFLEILTVSLIIKKIFLSKNTFDFYIGNRF
jgi:folylpolyglutamate synthase